MGFLKELGKFTGQVAGQVIGGSVRVVGELTGSDFIKEIGDGAQRATENAGRVLGNAASGVWDVAAGIVQQDELRMEDGFRDVGGAVGETARGIGASLVNVVENSGQVIEGIKNEDSKLLKEGAKGLLKTAAVATLAIGVIDIIDGVDVAEAADVADLPGEGDVWTDGEAVEVAAAESEAVELQNAGHETAEVSDRTVENSNTHHVEPHWRELEDGTRIWVDGDGDTSVNTYGGWDQTNPDYKAK